jgi:AsmA protein
MSAEEQIPMDKRWLTIGGIVVGVFLFVILLAPFFVNAETFKPTIESQLSTALGRNVTMGKLSFSILGGSLNAEEIAIADDPAFSKVPFIQAKKLDVGVELLPLIFHHQVRITKLTIDTPSMQLIEHANGKWNYSSLGGASSPASNPQQSSIPDLSVGELKIVNGSALVSSIPVTAKPFEYTDVDLTVKSFSFLKSFPFDLSAKLPAGGTLKLNGDAGPISQKDTTQTPFHATLQLREFDPVASGVIDPSKGITMDTNLDAQITSDGTTVSSTGKITASQLKLVPRGSTAQQPVEIDFSASQNLNTREGTLSDVAVHTGSVAVHVNGTFQFTAQALMLNLHLSAPGLPIDQLEQLLPTVGIHLPSGSSLQGGTLTANIAITGAATAATMTGPVEIDNTKLAGFDLGSKIQGLNPFGGTGGGTQIQVLKANVNTSPDGTKITDIYGNVPQIGSATGEGTVDPSGSLDFHLTAALNSSNAIGAVANTAANAVGGLVGSFLHPKQKAAPAANRGIPLTITGSASSPSIHANIGAMLK